MRLVIHTKLKDDDTGEIFPYLIGFRGTSWEECIAFKTALSKLHPAILNNLDEEEDT